MKVWFECLKTFMDTHQEIHAFVIGWGLAVSLRRFNWEKINQLYGSKENMESEFHYFCFGLALGMFSIIGFITAMVDILI